MIISVANKLNRKIAKRFITGFTLVEIVIVIGIMALLSSVIFTSFDGAKAKSRDQQRVTDISTIQLALEIYFNREKQYPDTLNDFTASDNFTVPTPPVRSGGYNYFPMKRKGVAADRCVSYHLWTKLENNSSFLDSRKGFDSVSLPSALTECGTDHSTAINALGDPLIYDVTP